MVQALLPRESNDAAKHVGFEAHVRVGKNQPFTGGSLVSFLERMRLAEPAGRKFGDMNDAKPRMQYGEIIQNPARGICRTVVDRHNFEIRIINFHERGERGGQFLFFVSRGQKNGNTRAVGVGRWRDILDDGEMQRSISDVESVENPERSDESEENQPE